MMMNNFVSRIKLTIISLSLVQLSVPILEGKPILNLNRLYDDIRTYNNEVAPESSSYVKKDTCSNAIGKLEVSSISLCENNMFNILYDSTTEVRNWDDTLIFVLSTNPDPDMAATGQFLRLLDSTMVYYEASYMIYLLQYYIFALLGKKNGKGGIDYTADCVQVSGPKPFIFYQIPSPNAGPDDTICGTDYTLQGLKSIPGSSLKWKIISGSGLAIENDESAITNISTNGKFETYVLELTEDNNGCVATDRVNITFNALPFIHTLEKSCINFNCIDLHGSYIAKIIISNGQPPYKILKGNGMINDSIFTTDTLASLNKFTVEIQDANGCVSNLLIDDHDCLRDFSEVGLLDTIQSELCVDQCITIRSLIPEILNPEDNILYILHDSSYDDPKSALDTLYSISDIVCFDNLKMVAGKTYYITRVIGKKLRNTNLIDTSDSCLRVSNDQPFVWYSFPQINAGRDAKRRDLITTLRGTASHFETGSWQQISGPGSSIFENKELLKTRLKVNEYGLYCFMLTVNYKGCISRDTVCINFYKIKTTDPDSPDKTYDDRNKSLFKKHILNDFFTPNFISNRGFTFISFTHDVPAKLNYCWINSLGQNEMSGQLHIQSNQQIEIPSPVKYGFYLLLVEINGVYEVNKICVME